MQGIAAFPNSPNPALVELPDSGPPSAGQVLCRTLELGVCGTDREILRSQRPLVPPGAEFLVLGHECLARVEQTGTGVDELREGDLVVPVVRRAHKVDVARPDMLAFGTYTERGIVREHGFSTPWFFDEPRHLLRIAPSLAPVAVFTEPLSIAEKGANEALAVQQGRLDGQVWRDPPPRVLVSGMGPIGFAGVLASVCRGWPVTMYGRDAPDSFRAQLAVSLGANYVRATQFAHPPDDVERDGYDLILECTGSDDVILRLAGWLAACGVMVWLGSSRLDRERPHNVDLLVRNSLLRNHVFLGSINAARRDFEDAVAHLAQLMDSHPAELQKLITERVDMPGAFAHYENRQPQAIKTVVAYA